MIQQLVYEQLKYQCRGMRRTLGRSSLMSCLRLSHLFLSIQNNLPLHGTGQVQGRASVARCLSESISDAEELYFIGLNVALLV